MFLLTKCLAMEATMSFNVSSPLATAYHRQSVTKLHTYRG